MPLSALFVLFDFVVHNPYHPESSTNLKFLDVAGAYFTRLEYATGSSLPSSLVAEFALIARQFVRDIQMGNASRKGTTNVNDIYVSRPKMTTPYPPTATSYEPPQVFGRGLIPPQHQLVSLYSLEFGIWA